MQQREPGRYAAKLINHNVVKSSEKGTPGVEMVFEYEDEDGDRHTINGTVWLAESNLTEHLDKTQRTFDTFDFDIMESGFDFSSWQEPEDVEDSPYIGMDCSIVLEEEEYEKDGKIKTAIRVRWINAPGGGMRTWNEDGGEDALAKIKELAGVGSPARSKKRAARKKAARKKATKKTTKNSARKKTTNADDDDAPPF